MTRATVFLTGSLGVGYSAEEDLDEPLERVLVHGVDVSHVGHAEEQDLGVNGHGDVFTSHFVDISLRLLSHHHLSL